MTQCFSHLPSTLSLAVLPPGGLCLPRALMGRGLLMAEDSPGTPHSCGVPGWCLQAAECSGGAAPAALSSQSPAQPGSCPWELSWDPSTAQDDISTGARRDGDRLRNVCKECLSSYLHAELTQTQQKLSFRDSLFQSMAWSPAEMQPPALQARSMPWSNNTQITLFYIYCAFYVCLRAAGSQGILE